MNYLQYKSDEMFSSTQLIRKSKMIFDKLSADDIEKAVILRDGKPSFLLMDFEKYEAIMLEYIELKKMSGNKQVKQKENPNSSNANAKNTAISTNSVAKEELSSKEQEELDKALSDLENLQFEKEEGNQEELKEFWD